MSRVSRNDLSRDDAAAVLAYDADTGLFRWADVAGNGKKAGREVGTVCSTGHVLIRLGSTVRLAHRLAWLLYHGVMPAKCLDHLNGIRHDNRIANLREVTPAGNAQNLREAHRDNQTGLLGVSYWAAHAAFRADIWVTGKSIYLGSFVTAEDAHAAYLTAKRTLHSGCTI